MPDRPHEAQDQEEPEKEAGPQAQPLQRRCTRHCQMVSASCSWPVRGGTSASPAVARVAGARLVALPLVQDLVLAEVERDGDPLVELPLEAR